MTIAPGYDLNEVSDIFKLAYAVNAPTPDQSYDPDKSPVFNRHAPAEESPLVREEEIPSVWCNRWPAGWVAGVPARDKTWKNSLIQSGKPFLNQAMIARRTSDNAYCLAFRGTVNAGNAMEDFFAIPVTAGEMTGESLKNLGFIDDLLKALLKLLPKRSYVSGNHPTDPRAQIHLGFRLALESLDFYADNTGNKWPPLLSGIGLTRALKKLPDGNIDLYITGHSLGAALAAVATCWLATQPIENKRFTIKSFPFAQPKPGNDFLVNSCMMSLGPGRVYHHFNSLDTVPQVPLTLQIPADLNYFEGLEVILKSAGGSFKVPAWMQYLGITEDKIEQWFEALMKGLQNPLIPGNFNFVHLGQAVVLDGPALPPHPKTPDSPNLYVWPFTSFPKYLFPAPTGDKNPDCVYEGPWTQAGDGPEIVPESMVLSYQQLWQHMPAQYSRLLWELRHGRHE